MEVAVDAKGEITIPRVDIAVDCGATVNPDRVRAQMQGACVMGVSVATLGEMSFKAGRAEQDNFHKYEITRMGAAPRDIRVYVIPGDYSKPMGGVGEPGRATGGPWSRWKTMPKTNTPCSARVGARGTVNRWRPSGQLRRRPFATGWPWRCETEAA